MQLDPPPGAVFLIAALCLAAYAAAAGSLAKKRRILVRPAVMAGNWRAGRSFGVFLLFILAQIVAAATHQMLFGGLDTPGAVVVLAVLVYAFNGLTLYVAFSAAGPGPLYALGVAGRPPSDLLRGIWLYFLFLPVLLLYGAASAALWKLTTGRGLPMQDVGVSLADAGPVNFAILAFLAAIVAPVVEEILFRGFIQRGFENSFGRRASLVLTTLLFTVAHGPKGMLVVFPVAIALTILYDKSRSLPLCMAFHFAVNFTSVLLVLAARVASA